MSDFVEKMAYAKAGGDPWWLTSSRGHQAVPVSNDMTPKQIIGAAGLNWRVEKRPLYFQKRNEDGTLSSSKLRVVPGEYGLVRSTDDMYFDTVGENYKESWQNEDVFDFFKRYVEAGDMQMETAGSVKNGKFTWALARIKNAYALDLGKGDTTNWFMLISLAHQLGYAPNACLTAVRTVCWNTLVGGGGVNKETGLLESGAYKIRFTHAREFDDSAKAEIERHLGLANESIKAYSHTAQMLSQSRAKDDDIVEYFHKTLKLEQEEPENGEDPEEKENRTVTRFREALTHAPGQELFKETWWNAFNAVTYTVDHHLGRDENRLYNAWYGTNSATKRRALELAVEYAKAA